MLAAVACGGDDDDVAGAAGAAGTAGLAGQGGTAAGQPGEGGAAGAGAGGAAGDAGAPPAGAGGTSSAGAGGSAAEPSLQFVPVDEDGQRQPPVTESLWGDEIVMTACGLPVGETVQLHVEVATYSTEASFVVDPTGCLDTGTQAPVAGNWTQADSDGPFWSLRLQGPEPTSNNAYLPVKVSVRSGDQTLVKATLKRHYADPGVTFTTVKKDGLVGLLAMPPGPGPHPVLIAFGGSEGGISSGAVDANQYASKGIATLGLAYFAESGLPDTLSSIPLEYFAKAFAWVAAQPSIDAGRLAVRGTSRGGELALLLGATFPAVRAVVANAPSGYLWGSTSIDGGPAWTYEGKPLPQMPSEYSPGSIIKAYDGTKMFSSTPQFEHYIEAATQAERDAATIHVEDIQGPVLMLSGEQDALWPSCAMADVAWQRLVSSGHSTAHADASFCLPGAGHSAAGLPGLSTMLADRYAAPGGKPRALGGTPEGIAHAQREARRRTVTFLRKALQP